MGIGVKGEGEESESKSSIAVRELLRHARGDFGGAAVNGGDGFSANGITVYPATSAS
jgi:hypothetical protein